MTLHCTKSQVLRSTRCLSNHTGFDCRWEWSAQMQGQRGEDCRSQPNTLTWRRLNHPRTENWVSGWPHRDSDTKRVTLIAAEAAGRQSDKKYNTRLLQHVIVKSTEKMIHNSAAKAILETPFRRSRAQLGLDVAIAFITCITPFLLILIDSYPFWQCKSNLIGRDFSTT